MDTSSASRRSIIINSFRVKSRQPTADIQVRFHFQQLSELLRALIANLQIVFKRIASAFFESKPAKRFPALNTTSFNDFH